MARGSTRGRARRRAADLSSVEGLYDVALDEGGVVGRKATDIVEEKPSFMQRVGSALGKGLGKVLDVAQRPNFAIASATKNVLDRDRKTTLIGGLRSGFTGETKNTFSDVFTELGVNPESRAGKIAKGTAGFALDVLLDPTTYLTFGAGAGAKVLVKGSQKTLSKAGTQLLKKGVATKAGQEFGEKYIRETIALMAEKSPAMYQKFIDQGGIKFFGNTLISSGRIAGVVQKIPGMTKLDEATLPFRNTLHSLVDRNVSAKFGRLPQEFVDISDRLRDLGKTRSEAELNKIIDIARVNKINSQEAELITNAIETGLPLADTRLDNARKLFAQSLGRNLADERAVGISTKQLPNYVPHMLLDVSAKNIPFKPTGVRVSTPFNKGRQIEGTISNIEKDIGVKFDPNIVNTAAIRGVTSARAVTAKEFMTEVGQKFGALADVAPTNYVEVGAKELSGLKFHPAIAEAIDKMGKSFVGDEGTNAVLRAFDKAQNVWKASVTSMFPAFHGRNAISNVFLNFLDIGSSALNPARHVRASQMLSINSKFNSLSKAAKGADEVAQKAAKELKELTSKVVFKDDTGKSWTFGALRKELQDKRVAFGDEYTGFLDIRETIADKLKQTTRLDKTKQIGSRLNPLSSKFAPFQVGRTVGNAIEQQARILNFLTNLEKTGSVDTAAQRTKQFLFDYTNLSDFEKNVMRRLIPFYTFTRKNIELQVGQLARQPGKLAIQAKLFTNISKTLSGSSLTEEETKLLPNYLQEGLGIIVKRNGDKLEIINSIGTPIESVFASLKPTSLLGSMSPVLAIPLQVAIGKNFFFDKDIKDVDNAIAYKNAPQFVKDYIGLVERKNADGSTRYVSLDPTRMFIMNNIPPSSRVIGTIGQLNNENVSGKLKVLRLLTGLKPYGANLTDLEIQKETQKKKALQDLLDKSGVAPIFKRSFIPSN